MRDTLKKTFKTKKRAVSEMIAYVILISIAMGIAIGVYAWLMVVGPPSIEETVDCKEGTSVTLNNINCLANGVGGQGHIELEIKNNGRFNIDGVIISVGPDSDKVPIDYLLPTGSDTNVVFGYQGFTNQLEPGETEIISFDYIKKDPPNGPDGSETEYNVPEIKIIQVQPVIFEKGKKVVCENSLFIDNNIQNCLVG